jgi:hypothetical protein
MKTLILKILPLYLVLVLACSLNAQTISTTAGTITSCPGQVVVPVTVTNCNDIGAISLILNYDNTQLTYTGFQNLNGALMVGLLIINSTGSKVVISWANTTAATLGNSTLVELKFTAIPGGSTLSWDTQTPGNCEYSDVSGNILPAAFTNGTATINQPPVINTQPVNKTAYVGDNATFSVAAAGTGLAYLWQYSTNGGGTWNDLVNNAIYSGVTTTTLSITNTLLTYNGYKYRCRLTGTCTPVTNTNEVTLTVINPITTILPTASFCPGSIVVPVTVTNFSGVAAFSLAFSYNNSVLTYTGFQLLNGALSAGTFVSNASGGNVYLTWSSTAPVTFGNGTIVELLFNAATGTSSLVWDLANEGNCEYSASDGSKIAAVFTNGNETIHGVPLVTGQPVNKIIAKGQNTSFSITATGSGLAFLWQVSSNGGSTFTDLTNAGYYSNVTSPTMNITGAQLAISGYQYRCRVSGTCLPVVFSNPATLTVLPNIITACGTTTGCPGQVIVPVNVTDFIGVASFSLALNFNNSVLTYTGFQSLNAALSGGSFVNNANDGTLYLTWSNTVAATIPTGGLLLELKFTGVPGASTLVWDTQTPGNCEYSDLTGQVIFSTWTNGAGTINTPPGVGTNPVNKTIYAGGSTNFSVTATGTSPAYVWQVSTNGGVSFSNLSNVLPYSGVTTQTLSISPAATGMNGYLYKCIISGACSPSVTSNAAQLTVTQAAITTTPGSVSGSCTGNLNIPLNVTNCTNVGSISLAMVYDTTKMSYEGYHSVNAALSGGMLVVNRSADKVFLSWASTSAANIGNGVLIQFRFRAVSGISTTLGWDTQTPGACEYSDPGGVVITSFYSNSSVSVAANALIVNAGNDIIMQSASVQLNGSATGGTPPYTWSWTPTTWLSNPAIPNPVASPTATTTYTLTVTTATCTGSDPVDVIISVPANLTLQNITVGNGQTNCYNATQTITVAGGTTSFIVQSGGSVTLIAGVKINFLPGAKVNPGGYLHGYITTTGQYCNTLPAAMVSTDVGENSMPVNAGSLFRIFPNPTGGQFTVANDDDVPGGNVYMVLYGPRGELILSKDVTGTPKSVFDISDQPAGLYFVRINAGNKCQTVKLIKQ